MVLGEFKLRLSVFLLLPFLFIMPADKRIPVMYFLLVSSTLTEVEQFTVFIGKNADLLQDFSTETYVADPVTVMYFSGGWTRFTSLLIQFWIQHFAQPGFGSGSTILVPVLSSQKISNSYLN
jgi:hypothetical protein